VITLARYYRAGSRLGLLQAFQYRGATFLELVGFFIEPAVYLSVWRTVAEAQGGSIGSYTSGELAAYYIVWSLVRVMNLAFTPYGWEWRIRGGRLNDFLSKPINPFHRDFSFFAGQKVVWILLWLPAAAVLTLTFRPTLSPNLGEVLAFLVAIWLGFAVRFTMLYLMGMITFWTTRAGAAFQMIMAGELLLSGRLVPLELMPDWVERLAGFLPFQWSFQFPIEVLIGRLTTAEIIGGFGLQLLWAGAMGAAFALVWRRATKRYTAVGG
jgi:ABC-2 type transport system permease protein